MSLLLGLCAAAGVEVASPPAHDASYLQEVRRVVAPGTLADLAELASAFKASLDTFEPQQLLDALHVAEDRAGAVCAADPRPRLRELAERGTLAGPRGTSVVGYLLSDDHLTLRHNLGYLTEVAAPIRREEEPSA